jgi:hypothetical protein
MTGQSTATVATELVFLMPLVLALMAAAPALLAVPAGLQTVPCSVS